MEYIGKKVLHKKFGIGEITDATDKNISVNFVEGLKVFVFPDAFEMFLQFEDESVQAFVLNLIQDKKQKEIEEKELARQKELEEKQRKLEIEQEKEKAKKPRKVKEEKKANIAFKCNYCNGNIDDNLVGFAGACDDEHIKYNIEVAKHKWCSNEECLCCQYYNGTITREELDGVFDEEDGFVCYESQMLTKWRAGAGTDLEGENAGRRRKLKGIRLNSLAILTTRTPEDATDERFIFAAFLVDDTYEGDSAEEGYVSTASKYKISLTLDEAKQLKFWNYYYNQGNPKSLQWGTGLYRYITDEQAAQILRGIVEIKTDKDEKAFANEFYEYFCRINGIDKAELPAPRGALLFDE